MTAAAEAVVPVPILDVLKHIPSISFYLIKLDIGIARSLTAVVVEVTKSLFIGLSFPIVPTDGDICVTVEKLCCSTDVGAAPTVFFCQNGVSPATGTSTCRAASTRRSCRHVQTLPG